MYDRFHVQYRKMFHILIVSFLALILDGCDQGPEYQRPHLESPVTFKNEHLHWKKASLTSHPIPETWWKLFNDDRLNHLHNKLMLSNLTIQSAEASYYAALADLKQKNALYYPTLGATTALSREKTASSQAPVNRKATNVYTIGLSVGWEIDVFNKTGKEVDAATASTEAELAHLKAVRLSQHALLTQYYFQLKVVDHKNKVLQEQKKSFEALLQIARNRYASGFVDQKDVLQAQQQLEASNAQYLDNQIQRSKLENAIATLLGTHASKYHHQVTDDLPQVPEIPYQVPSALLEKRPDIIQAEWRVAEANARIGLERTAYFPSLILSSTGGFQSQKFFEWFTMPSRFWSIGPELAYNIFDGGNREARIAIAENDYERIVADYKNTVLIAFQEVEDFLAEIYFLKKELDVQRQSTTYAQQALIIATHQYQSGIISYNDVLIAQNLAFSAELLTLDILSRLMIAAVNYVKAIGGQWSFD